MLWLCLCAMCWGGRGARAAQYQVPPDSLAVTSEGLREAESYEDVERAFDGRLDTQMRIVPHGVLPNAFIEVRLRHASKITGLQLVAAPDSAWSPSYAKGELAVGMVKQGMGYVPVGVVAVRPPAPAYPPPGEACSRRVPAPCRRSLETARHSSCCCDRR